jgi:hypothetical protein
MAYPLLTLVGIALLGIVLLLRKVPLRRQGVPPWAAFLGIGAALAGGGGCVLLFDPDALGLPRGQPEQMRVEPLPEGSYPEGPLAVGENVPPLEAAGWLNSPPPRPGTPGLRLIVLDVWAHW